jgi:alpha-L-fucosidase
MKSPCLTVRSAPPRPARRVRAGAVRALGAAFLLWAARAGENPPPTDAAALAHWQALRFGLFIHWGPVSLRGTEIGWSRGAQVPIEEYDRLYREFNPTNFNAADWVATAKAAGMKYLVFTSKHHDGFCMWDSRYTEYDIMSTPFRRDVVRELAEACRREGVLFGLYHSICDWWHPDYPLGSPGGKTRKPAPNLDRYTAYLKHQLAELLQNYGPLGVLWFDGEWEAPWDEARGRDLYAYCRALQPSVLINNRVSKARNDLAGTSREGFFAGDFDTPEQQVGRFNTARPWESCITLCQQWAWKPKDRLKSLEECLRTLITCAGGDGNLLLNVGPMPDGRIEPRQAARLREIGAWLARYGEAIYATRGGPYKPGRWGASTHRGNTVYLHLFEWPSAEGLTLPPLPRRVLNARVLDGPTVPVHQTASGLEVHLPAANRQPIVTVMALELDGPARELPPLAVGSPPNEHPAPAEKVLGE